MADIRPKDEPSRVLAAGDRFLVDGITTGSVPVESILTNIMAWYGVKGDGVTDDAPAMRAAIAGTPDGSKLRIPHASVGYLLNSVGTDGHVLGMPFNKSILIEGDSYNINSDGAYTPAGSIFILGAAIPDTADIIRYTGDRAVFGAGLKNIAFVGATNSFHSAPVGRHAVHIDASASETFYHFGFIYENVFTCNMKTGKSFKTTANGPATATASISGTTMTIATLLTGAFIQGGTLTGTGVTIGTQIVNQLTGTAGGAGTYTVSISQTVSSTTITSAGNAGGGAMCFSRLRDSKWMCSQFDYVGDSVLLQGITSGQNATLDSRNVGVIFNNVTGATSFQVVSGTWSNLNGMVICDGGTSPIIDAAEFEQATTAANTHGSMIHWRGSVSKVYGPIIRAGTTVSQISTLGNYDPVLIENAENAVVEDGVRISIPSAYTHIKITSAALNPYVGKVYATTAGAAIDVLVSNASTTANSQKVNIGTINGSDLLNVGGNATISGFHMPGGTSGIFTLLPPSVASGTFRFPAGSTDMTTTGGGSQVLRQNSVGAPITVGNIVPGDISGLAAGVATFLGAPSSANLAAALTDETGSGKAVFDTSPKITTPDIVGVTGATNANAGSVGEYLTNTGTLTTVTTNVAINVAQITLTAGDWDVEWEVVDVLNSASTNITQVTGSVSTTSATHSFTMGDYAVLQYGSGGVVPGNGNAITLTGMRRRFNVSSPTTLYLVASSTFTVSTNQMNGIISARRPQ